MRRSLIHFSFTGDVRGKKTQKLVAAAGFPPVNLPLIQLPLLLRCSRARVAARNQVVHHPSSAFFQNRQRLNGQLRSSIHPSIHFLILPALTLVLMGTNSPFISISGSPTCHTHAVTYIFIYADSKMLWFSEEACCICTNTHNIITCLEAGSQTQEAIWAPRLRLKSLRVSGPKVPKSSVKKLLKAGGLELKLLVHRCRCADLLL